MKDFRRAEDDEDFKAGVFYGRGVAVPRAGSRRAMGQPSPSAVEQIRQMFGEAMRESLPPALEDGAALIAKRYETTGMIVMGAIVVTAVATSIIALVMILDR